MRFGVIATILLLCSIFAVSATTYEMRIEIGNFNPEELTINVGDDVKFASFAGSRRIIFDDGTKTGFLSAGTSTTKTFDNVGTVTFQIGGEPEITGQIEVLVSGAPPPVEFYDIGTAPPGEFTFVAADDYEFLPAEIEVNVGDTVVWANIAQTAHSVDFYDDPFEKGVVNKDITYNRTFIKPGLYSYKCRFHNAMKGAIKVVDPGPTPPAGATGLDAQIWEQPSTGVEYDIVIEDFAFDSSWIAIEVGDTVTWFNTGDETHTAMADDITFDTGDIKPSESSAHTFTLPGIYEYTCGYHPDMKGTIVVNAAKADDEDVIDDFEEPIMDIEEPVITAPVVEAPDQLIVQLNKLREELQKQFSTGPVQRLQSQVDSVDSKVDQVQAQVSSLATGLGDVQQNVQDVERLARNPPKIELPAIAPPVMVYVSLALDLLLLLIILGMGVYLLRKPSGSKMLPPPKPKTQGVSSVVKAKPVVKNGQVKPEMPKIEPKGIVQQGMEKQDMGMQKPDLSSHMIPGKKMPEHDPFKDTIINSKQPESSDPTQIYIKRCREKGLTDQQIITRFKKSGWSDERAKKAVKGN